MSVAKYLVGIISVRFEADAMSIRRPPQFNIASASKRTRVTRARRFATDITSLRDESLTIREIDDSYEHSVPSNETLNYGKSMIASNPTSLGRNHYLMGD